jgi:ribosomal protein S18 acetylase RimI-like enzyme
MAASESAQTSKANSTASGSAALKPFSVRRATPADVPDMQRVWQETVDMLSKTDVRYRLKPNAAEIWHKSLLDNLARDDMAIFVAESTLTPGRILGFIVGSVTDNLPTLLPERHGFVGELAVDSHGKASGIGRQMLDALKAWFAERGVTHVQALVSARHPVAQAFWRALGASEMYDLMWLRLE